MVHQCVGRLVEAAWCRGDPAAEYSRKLEYLKREEELIKEEELEAEAILQPSGQSLQVTHHQLDVHHCLKSVCQQSVLLCCRQVSLRLTAAHLLQAAVWQIPFHATSIHQHVAVKPAAAILCLARNLA